MTRFSILAVGKLKDGAERQIFERYVDRAKAVGRGLGIQSIVLHEVADGQGRSIARRQAAESKSLLAKLPDKSLAIVLDEKGRNFTTNEFADYLQKQIDAGQQTISFLIGGADGHGSDALDRGQLALSLSDMTLPHGLARIVLAEQIYRAMTILSGHPYHRS